MPLYFSGHPGKNFTDTVWFRLIIIFAVIIAVLIILYRIYVSIRHRHLSDIVYSREFSEEGVYEGEQVELIETVRNTGFFPLFRVDIESYIYNELEGLTPDPRAAMQCMIGRFNLMPYMQIRRRHRITTKARGEYTLGIVSVYTKKEPITIEAPAELFVYPRVIPLDLNTLAVGRLEGEYISARPLYEDRFSLAGIRDYRFGDTVSQINFKASARVPMNGMSASPFKVNARDFCAGRKLMIYMDYHLPMGSAVDGAEYRRRAERGLAFCSALVRDAVFGGYRVGFAANCRTVLGEMSVGFGCEAGSAQLIAIMKEMARFYPREGGSFTAMLDKAINDGMSDTEIIIINYDTGEEVMSRLATLDMLGNLVTVIPLTATDEDIKKPVSDGKGENLTDGKTTETGAVPD